MTEPQGTARIVERRTVGRRTVVAAAGAVGLGAALVACGGSDDTSDSSGSSDSSNGAAEQPTTGGDAGAAGGGVLAKTTDIPEGGGMVFADQGVVVTQPTAGEYKAFSSKCTHTGCAVKDIADGVIHCPCHGSQFSAADGSVKAGPATKPLPAASIKVSGTSITLA
ncbi:MULTISPECIES: Rieske (2Fe-2S) protein [unclassified Streptomyces]|uniref:Rieske (2Fe-2S) protein n=1 Tax=unclassified Streptomyces TaxID=2593676 RepID=UPI002E765DF1|nr:Rieske (2Fe-2S) protein [Streptomyces sp. JV176]MEE1799012.1 Rieske (2Fe-2S) protein [Streptomyces sp. JV176]